MNKKDKFDIKGSIKNLDKNTVLSGAVIALFLTSFILGYKLYYKDKNLNNVKVFECNEDCQKHTRCKKEKKDFQKKITSKKMNRKFSNSNDFDKNLFEDFYDDMEESFENMSGSFEVFADRFDKEFFEPIRSSQERNKFIKKNFHKEEDDSSIKYIVNLENVDKDAVDISIINGDLNIKVEREFSEKEKKEDYYSEISNFSSYSKSFSLPMNVDSDSAKATIEKNKLIISFEKIVKDKKIEIK